MTETKKEIIRRLDCSWGNDYDQIRKILLEGGHDYQDISGQTTIVPVTFKMRQEHDEYNRQVSEQSTKLKPPRAYRI